MPSYKKKLDKRVWSYTTLDLYYKCPYAFSMKVLEGIKGDTNAAAEIGSYGHKLFEEILTGKLTISDALTDCVENFDDHVTAEISEASYDKKYTALCQYLSDVDENLLFPFDILGVEQRVNWKIGKYKFIGFLDLVLCHKETGELWLVDHKSSPHFLKKDGTPLVSTKPQFESYKRQMYLYADAMQKTYGEYPKWIVWNHFLDDGKLTKIPFKQEELDETLAWVDETLKAIYADKEFLPKWDYARCKMLCDYRNGYCEYSEEDPDAELS